MNIINRINLTLTPTPLQKLNAISAEYNSSIFIKRDDLLGLGFGGNKLRKLEYIISDVVEKQTRLIITSGSLQTNHGMLTALVASKLGIDCTLFLLIEDEQEKVLSGNLLLDDYLSCNIEFLDVSDIVQSENLCIAKKDELVSKALDFKIREYIFAYTKQFNIADEEIYIIKSAGSTPLGVLGYVNCMKELSEQFPEGFDYIFCGNGSGGTYAGLSLGVKIYMPDASVIGINIEEMNPSKPKFIENIANEAAELLNINQRLIQDDIILSNCGVGKGYAVPDNDTLSVIEYFARTEGIFLDPVYSAKVAAGTLKYIQKNSIRGKNILILHSGGLPGLFNNNMLSYRNRNSDIIDRWKHDTNKESI